MSYIQQYETIGQLFESADWTNRAIMTTFADVEGLIPEGTQEFIRVAILPQLERNVTYGQIQSEGEVVVQIFSPSGVGRRRILEIQDFLAPLLSNKSLGNGIQTFAPRVNQVAPDRVDPGLLSVTLTVDYVQYAR